MFLLDANELYLNYVKCCILHCTLERGLTINSSYLKNGNYVPPAAEYFVRTDQYQYRYLP